MRKDRSATAAEPASDGGPSVNGSAALATNGRAPVASSVLLPRPTTSDRPPSPAPQVRDRPYVDGKFLFADGQKLYVKGVTYGTFRPDPEAGPYPPADVVRRDFASMAANGFNALRTYTPPPVWMLDLAAEHGLRVLVGLPWGQHVTFLEDPAVRRAALEGVRAGVARCAGHPAVLAYAIGNEIPAAVVRWHGPERVERWLERLFEVAKAEDPGGLATYVNFPTTEYLRLPFLDFLCFNVFLEERAAFERYLARLHNLAGERPLVMAEIGLDSRRHGTAQQAQLLSAQVSSSFRSGCAGAFVFAWTDDWHRGGYDVRDWDFGLTDRQRHPKPALAAVAGAFDRAPVQLDADRPFISVVVCSLNGASTLPECLQALHGQEYPHFEVVLVDDGSSDATAAIGRAHGCRVISTPNRGLASARNSGIQAARGEIVAFVDDDVRADRHWLSYLAAAFSDSGHVGVGGPNIAPVQEPRVAQCIDQAPGNPAHVLLSDRQAEHLPGCNSAYRKSALQAVDGFDKRFRAAGDDVDLCWRLQERGWTLGFHPAAMVWHHRRSTLRSYWRQQHGYGRAEALLERKWPEKYNGLGHLTWSGRMYGGSFSGASPWSPSRRRRIYHGRWGAALFQSVYEPAQGAVTSLPLMPEWYVLIAALAAISLLGITWRYALLAVPLLSVAVLCTLARAALGGARAGFAPPLGRRRGHWGLRALTALCHLLQPAARLSGRVTSGLTPWRQRAGGAPGLPMRRVLAAWSERWRSAPDRLAALADALRAERAPVVAGGEYDRWDLEVRNGLLGGARALMAIEEHGEGRQLIRLRVWPRVSLTSAALNGLTLGLAVWALADRAWIAGGVLAALALAFCARTVQEAGGATALVARTFGGEAGRPPDG